MTDDVIREGYHSDRLSHTLLESTSVREFLNFVHKPPLKRGKKGSCGDQSRWRPCAGGAARTLWVRECSASAKHHAWMPRVMTFSSVTGQGKIDTFLWERNKRGIGAVPLLSGVLSSARTHAQLHVRECFNLVVGARELYHISVVIKPFESVCVVREYCARVCWSRSDFWYQWVCVSIWIVHARVRIWRFSIQIDVLFYV